MFSRIFRKIQIKRHELPIVLVLSLMAVALGVFISSYDIVAHVCFFESYSETEKSSNEYLAIVYLASGLIGLVMFFLYTQNFRRLSIKIFALINFTFVGAVALTYSNFILFGRHKMVDFLGLAAMFPINIFVLITFWRYARKLLTPEQTKRLFPFIEFFFISGIVLGGYAFTVGLYAFDFETPSWLIVIGASLLFILQFVVNFLHSKNPFLNKTKEKFIPVRSTLLVLFSSRYTTLLVFFVILASSVFFIVHMGFINLTWNNYQDKLPMAKFLGVFIGTVFIFTYFADRLVVHRVLYSYDSPFSLIIAPIAVFITLIGALGLKFLLGFSDLLPQLMVSFLLYGICKAALEVSKFSIQGPTIRVLFKTLDRRFAQVINPRVEGTLPMLGLILSGGIAVGLYSINFFDGRSLLLVAIILTVVWFWLGVKLIKAYQVNLQSEIKRIRIGSISKQIHEGFQVKLRKLLVKDDAKKVVSALEFSAEIQPLTYEKELNRLLAHPSQEIKKYVLSNIVDNLLLEALPNMKELLASGNYDSKKELDEAIEAFSARIESYNDTESLQQKVGSLKLGDRIMVAQAIGVGGISKMSSSLSNLAREFEPEVKLAAVKAMARLKDPSHSYTLIEFLDSPELYAYAYEALVEIGTPALDYLEKAFVTPGIDQKVLARIVRIYGAIGSSKAIDMLLDKLENQNKLITEQAIASLRETHFQASNQNINRILNVIVRLINTYAHNLLVFISLSKKGDQGVLRLAMEHELRQNLNLLFDLLSLAYNPNAMNSIRELIQKGGREDISHAIEMLDQFVYEDIKPVLFPILEDISNEEKLKQLQYYFPIEKSQLDELLYSAITRDFNSLSLYPRACAMFIILEQELEEVPSELVFSLFHPNRLLHETAAYVIEKIQPGFTESVSERLEPGIYSSLLELFHKVESGNDVLLIDKLKYVKRTEAFTNLPEYVQLEIASSINPIRFAKGDIAPLEEMQDEMHLFMLAEGNIPTIASATGVFYLPRLLDQRVNTLEFQEDTLVYAIAKSFVQYMAFDSIDFADCVLICIDNVFRQEKTYDE